MKRLRKLSMFTQLLFAFCGMLVPVIAISIYYIVDVRNAYFERSVENAGYQLEQNVQILKNRMSFAEAYLAPGNYNTYQMRLRSVKPGEEFRVAADLYWQELNRQVIYGDVDVYFLYLPYADYTDVAVKTGYSRERRTLKEYIHKSFPEWSTNTGWTAEEIGASSWLLYAVKLGDIYVGAAFNLQGFTRDILESTGFSDSVAMVETEPAIIPDGYLGIERTISRRIKAVLLLNRHEVISSISSIPSFILVNVLILLLSLALLGYVFSRILVHPFRTLSEAMGQLENGNADYRITEQGSNRDAQRLNRHFNNMADSLTDMKIRVYEQELEKMEIEAMNLKLQVNPHFILNSLNIIFSMAKSSKANTLDQIRSFTKYLADYLRFTLWHTGGKVSLKEEIKCVQNYLEIQKVRFPGRFLYLCDMDDELEGGLIPPLLIQNFVENSIKYALDPERETEIYIIVTRTGERLHISICDTGNGMDEETVEALLNNEIIENESGKHIGIWNCRRRMNHMYGTASTFHITSRPQEGTQIYIEIPWEEL